MAQPLFDEHPLQEYFQGMTASAAGCSTLTSFLSAETGEFDEVMPGSHPAFAAETSTLGQPSQQQTIGKLVLRVVSRLQVSEHNT